MKLRSRMALGLLCALLAGPDASVAQDSGVGAEGEDAALESIAEADAAEAIGPDGDIEAYWARRLANASKRIEVARERLERATAAYSRARHDRDQRGESLVEIAEKRLAAETEQHDAEAALPRLVEQARRAGVPPGVYRDYWAGE